MKMHWKDPDFGGLTKCGLMHTYRGVEHYPTGIMATDERERVDCRSCRRMMPPDPATVAAFDEMKAKAEKALAGEGET